MISRRMTISFQKPGKPVLLCDKSTIQGLSKDEIFSLFKHFFILIPPVLIYEILGDLSSPNTDRIPEEVVINLSKKITQISTIINLDYRELCLSSLRGNIIELDGLPKINSVMPIKSKSGLPGIEILQTPEETALLQWSNGQFTDAEKILSSNFRNYSKNTDLADYATKFERLGITPNKTRNYKELLEETLRILQIPENQTTILKWFAKENQLPPGSVSFFLRRWKRGNFSFIKNFAPYGYYCIKVYLLFCLGVFNKVIGPRSSHKIDLEYCFYFPFCMIFSSEDKFHYELANCFLFPEQSFIRGSELKKDLKRIFSAYTELSREEQIIQDSTLGNYPRNEEDSITHELWERYMGQWSSLFGNVLAGKTPDERKEMIKAMGLENLFMDLGNDLRDVVELSNDNQPKVVSFKQE